jgi:uncharacterized membrane protein YphA (DoxX/SURF4 family)
VHSKTLTYSQLFLRIAIAASFLSAVADRFGLWGPPGTPGVNWGSWENFMTYSDSVNSFVSPGFSWVLGIVATSLEVILSLLLLIGFKTRLVALGSGILLTAFALAMTISFGVKPSLDYSVWSGAAGCYLLSTVRTFEYSVDQMILKSN